jgi:hypothetical protein
VKPKLNVQHTTLKRLGIVSSILSFYSSAKEILVACTGVGVGNVFVHEFCGQWEFCGERRVDGV